MTLASLALKSARHFWRTNIAVVAGIACAVAVLSGALLVGNSVRASLRELALSRLGLTDVVIASGGFFRQPLADEIASGSSAGLIVVDGAITHESSGARASGIAVYGVDDRFFRFHRIDRRAPGRNDALLSPALAVELGANEGDTVLLRARKPSDIPAEFLHGRRDEVGRAIRLRVAGVPGREELGEFSLRASQGGVRAVFVRLDRLQRDLERVGQINTVLVGGAADAPAIERRVRERATLEDIGIRLRPVPSVKSVASSGFAQSVAVESRAGMLDDAAATAAIEAARSLQQETTPILTYLANAIRIGGRQVPYSLVTALNRISNVDLSSRRDGIVLNAWAARELGATAGDKATLDYYVWDPGGRLIERSASFQVLAIVPIDAADRDFAPDYPGITESESLADWDPPFPLDLSRIRPVDEQYWDEHRATPKAFVSLRTGQELWGSRYGRLTAVRIAGGAGVEQALRSRLDPLEAGLTVVDARRDALEASAGATDFGEYFSYFSFFLVVSALLLGVLFFRLGVEQRLREIGALRAFGFTIARIRRLFVLEAAALAAVGALLGVLGAVAYAALIMLGLRTWWSGAVGTSDLRLHVSAPPLAIGALAGILLAVAVIAWTLHALRRAAPRALLAGDVAGAFASASVARPRRRTLTAVALAIAAALGVGAAAADVIPDAAGFFLAGALLLAAAVTAIGARLAARPSHPVVSAGAAGIARLGVRYATWRRGRSLLAVSLVAAAVFLIVSVEAFRKDEGSRNDRRSGTGGFALVAESTVPLFHDPSTPEGRDALNLQADASASAGAAYAIYRLRLRPGDDASCLNLYRPQRPRIVGFPRKLIDENRFTFAVSQAATPEERANAWRLLDRKEPGGAIPAIVDATSLQYVLHASLGDELSFGKGPAFKIVGTLADSVLQGELMISEERFVQAFPDEEGYRFFLVDVTGPRAAADRVAAFLETRLSDVGFDATAASDRLAAFHRVENTYLSTFQALGGFGLLLGTIGLAAIAVRNVLERRRELALLRAIGYAPRHLRLMLLAETGFLLALGVISGVVCAALAIAPALAERGGTARLGSLSALLAAVIASGALASILAARVAAREPVVEALKSE
ncbi:MAG TPA: FtsX-like permease family protein [Vicinamibacterales bacterium]|nr:FtsX-like permease family protein [Vicinamibacterales bacterium]